jgi:hypothetical protein
MEGMRSPTTKDKQEGRPPAWQAPGVAPKSDKQEGCPQPDLVR